MRILPRSLRRKNTGEAGFTLAEMLSTVVILGVLTSVVAAMFITSVQAMHDNTVRLDQVNGGRTAMETMTRVLRTSVLPSSLVTCTSCTDDTAFLQASPTTVQFYADIDNPGNTVGPSRVTIGVDAQGNLTESIQPPDPGSAVTGYTWNTASLKKSKLLAQGVKSSPSLFTYYLFGSTSPYPGTVPQGQLQNVDAVDIALRIALPGTSATPTTTLERVSLPNVDTIIESSATPSP